MATKLELLKEIYKTQNDTKILNGLDPVDLGNSKIINRMNEEAAKSLKLDLINRLETAKSNYEACKIKIEQGTKVAEYFTTPVGATFKLMLEKDIENKIEEWKAYDKETAQSIDDTIKTGLGSHWGVTRLSKYSNGGLLTIGVIDKENSTSECQSAYFGQDIGIRYEYNTWKGEKETFKTSCASCGDFDFDGGESVGERAMFYVGIGKLYGSRILVRLIKEALRSYGATTEKFSVELDALRKQLINPLGK